MEVKIKTKNKTFSFSIQEKAVNGITGSHYEELVDGISLKDILETEMTLDGKKLNRDEMRQYKQKIGLTKAFSRWEMPALSTKRSMLRPCSMT